MTCECGHPRFSHDFYDGCLTFLCCTRRVITTPGKRHTEHDGVNHKSQRCQCNTFVEKKSRWDEDREAGAIG